MPLERGQVGRQRGELRGVVVVKGGGPPPQRLMWADLVPLDAEGWHGWAIFQPAYGGSVDM